MNLLFAHRVQWHNEPKIIDPFKCLSCLVVRTNYLFFLPTQESNPHLLHGWNLLSPEWLTLELLAVWYSIYQMVLCIFGEVYAHPGIMHLSKWLWQGYVWPCRGLWQQQFFPISLWHHSDITNGRNIDLLGGDSETNSSWQGEDSDR